MSPSREEFIKDVFEEHKEWIDIAFVSSQEKLLLEMLLKCAFMAGELYTWEEWYGEEDYDDGYEEKVEIPRKILEAFGE